MGRLPPLPTIQEIIRIYGLSARKRLSQNFLLDLNLTQKIVKKAGNVEGCLVFEVGPGPGGITRSILNAGAKKVVAIEKDGRFIPSLETLADASDSRLDVVLRDALGLNLQPFVPDTCKAQWEDPPPPIHIIGNLPFSVSTPLMIRWLDQVSTKSNVWGFGRVPLTLTFQKEVAQRMVAPPRSEFRCRLSVMCQYLCDLKLTFTIPGKAFVPAPRVDVGVVKLVPKIQPLILQPFPLVEKLNRHLFNTPNKYCRKAVSTLFPLYREDLVCEMFEQSGVDQERRPFELSMDEIRGLCSAYAHVVGKEPEVLVYDFRDKQAAKQRRRRSTVVTSAIENHILHGSSS